MISDLFKRIFLPSILFVLTYGFWISPNFKEISAGVAIFLFGMLFLQQGFKAFTGGVLEKVLQKSTNKMWKSLLFGFSAAGLMQSSSLVSVLTISFLSAELITLVQGIGIMFGANIGTTTGAWLIAGFGMKINISAYAMPMLVFGIIFAFQKSKALKGIGSIIAGLGFLFLGIHYMKTGFESFQDSINLIEYAMTGFIGILAFTGIGILATIVMQSSHATIILVIAALATGQVSYENALALVIGANIGTTITAVIGSLTANISGKRLAVADVLFKVTTGIIFILFMNQIASGVSVLADIIGISSDNYTLKLAIFHTLFNISGVFIVIPLLPQLIKIVSFIFPEKSNTKDDKYNSIYLNTASIDFPDTALISLIKETRHLYNITLEVILESLGLEKSDLSEKISKKEVSEKIKIKDIEEIDALYNTKIKKLYGQIIDFATIAQSNNAQKYSENFYAIKVASRNLAEIIKSFKHLQKNLVKYSKSSQENAKEQYIGIIMDIIELIETLQYIEMETKTENKIMLLTESELSIKNSDILSNGTLDTLIRSNAITNSVATSLMNDSGYKNQISTHLLGVAELIYNTDISEEITSFKNKKKIKYWFQDPFGLSEKKLEKAVNKLVNRKNNLKQKLQKEKDSEEVKKIKKELELIKLTLIKYKK